MSLKIDINDYEEARYLTISETDNINSLFFRDDNDYVSCFHFAYYRDGKFHGYAGYIRNNDYEDSSFDEPLPNDADLYICINGAKTYKGRSAEDIINLQNIVIDIDAHNSNFSNDELYEHINRFIDKIKPLLLIKPNLINNSGRGVHLWYCIEPCHVSLAKIWMSVADMLCSNVEECMNSINESVLKLDRASTLKINGLFRVPYSYNTKARRWSNAVKVHEDSPNLNILKEKLTKSGYKSPYFEDINKVPKKKNKKKPKTNKYVIRKDIKLSNYFPCLIHRKRFLDYLFKTRNTFEHCYRHNMMFAMYATIVPLYGADNAKEYCLELNDTLDTPLKQIEMADLFKQVDKKHHRFENKKFLAFVNANEEERKRFAMNEKDQKKESNRQKKSERNDRILSLYNQGISITEISKIVAVSRPTVYNVINQ